MHIWKQGGVGGVSGVPICKGDFLSDFSKALVFILLVQYVQNRTRQCFCMNYYAYLHKFLQFSSKFCMKSSSSFDSKKRTGSSGCHWIIDGRKDRIAYSRIRRSQNVFQIKCLDKNVSFRLYHCILLKVVFAKSAQFSEIFIITRIVKYSSYRPSFVFFCYSLHTESV